MHTVSVPSCFVVQGSCGQESLQAAVRCMCDCSLFVQSISLTIHLQVGLLCSNVLNQQPTCRAVRLHAQAVLS